MPARQTSERSINVRPLRFLFAGGGTGGHLYPAIAIAEKIKRLEPSAEILFVGTKDKIEARVVPEHGFRFASIWISGFHRSIKLRNILFPVKVVVSMFQARSILSKYEPDVVVGTGGYVAGPVLRSAMHRHIPTLIQEQNSYPGVTTRLLARNAEEVHITFEESRKYLSGAGKVFLTGNPTRDSLEGIDRREALAYFRFSPDSAAKTILILGGSLGAHTVNEAVLAILGTLMESEVRIVWQSGQGDAARVMSECAKYPKERVWAGAFIDRIEYAYAVSDIVVSRAGATTIAELTRLAKPAILVPYPHAAANHQMENARALAEGGAAVVVDDKNLHAKLLKELRDVMKGETLAAMGRQSATFGKPEAARIIAERAIALAKARRDNDIGTQTS